MSLELITKIFQLLLLINLVIILIIFIYQQIKYSSLLKKKEKKVLAECIMHRELSEKQRELITVLQKDIFELVEKNKKND